jgi:hypothetical protein
VIFLSSFLCCESLVYQYHRFLQKLVDLEQLALEIDFLGIPNSDKLTSSALGAHRLCFLLSMRRLDQLYLYIRDTDYLASVSALTAKQAILVFGTGFMFQFYASKCCHE